MKLFFSLSATKAAQIGLFIVIHTRVTVSPVTEIMHGQRGFSHKHGRSLRGPSVISGCGLLQVLFSFTHTLRVALFVLNVINLVVARLVLCIYECHVVNKKRNVQQVTTDLHICIYRRHFEASSVY